MLHAFVAKPPTGGSNPPLSASFPRRTLASRLTHALSLMLVVAACTGPATRVSNPDGHRVFVDGQTLHREYLPFRYYGTSRWDAMPVDTPHGPDWSLRPSSGRIDLPPPATPWLFPFDFPLELLHRSFHGRGDVVANVSLPPAGPDVAIESEVTPAGLPNLLERAFAARTSR